MGRLQVNSNIDLYFNNVSLLLPFDNNFQDYSKNNFNVTVNGSPQISTAQSKFGGASAYFNGSSALNIPTSATQFNANQDFTIECWAYLSSYSLRGIIGTFDFGRAVLGVDSSGTLYFSRANVVAVAQSSSGAISLNTWHHIAVARSGSAVRMFINGNLVGSGTDSNAFLEPTQLQVGHFAGEGSWWWDGHIDDLRITKGVARYTSNFTPPSKLRLNINNKISINKQNLGGGKLLAKEFLPNDLNGLSLWLRADAGVTYDGSNNVSAWIDQSTAGNTPALDSIGIGNPQYKTNQINGKPCIFFNNTKSFIKENVNFNNWTVIHVSKLYNDPDGIGRIFSNRGAPNNILVGSWDNRDNRMYVGTQWVFQGTNTNYTWKLSIGTCSISQNRSFFYQNSQQLAGPVSTSQNLNGFAIGGGWRDDFPERAICDVAEVIIYNREIATQERQKIESYLNTKYNIY